MNKNKIFLLILFNIIALTSNGQKMLLSLVQCIDSALKNNINYATQLNQIKENELLVQQAQMNRLPTLNGSIGTGLSNGKNFNTNLGNSNTQTNYSGNAGLNSSVVLFNGFKNNNAIKQNSATVSGLKFDAEALRNSIITSVVDVYLQVLYSYEAISIAEEQLKTSDVQVQHTERLLQVGKIAETSVFQIKSQNATDRLNLVNAQNNLLVNKVTLFQLMEIQVEDRIEFNKINIDSCLILLNMDDAATRTDIYESALKVMPEIQSSQMNTKNVLYGLKIAKAEILPKLTLNAGLSTNYYSQYKQMNYDLSMPHATIGYLANDPSQKVVSLSPGATQKDYPLGNQLSDNFYKSASVALSIPIFNNYSVRNKIKIQQIALSSAKLNEQLTKNKLRKNIEQAYAQLVSAKKQYFAGKEQLIYATKSYESIKNKFQLGILNPTDLQVEKTNYLRAMSDFLQAKYQLLYAAKIIEYYKNGTIKLN